MSAFLRWCFWESISLLDRESPVKDRLYSKSQCASPLSLSLSFLIGIIFIWWLADSKLQSVFQLHSVQFRCSVVSDSLRPHEPQHARPPCPSPTPGVHPNPCPSSRGCHPTISSSVIPFSSCSQSFPASGSFPINQFFAWGGQRIGVSASTSVLPMNTQDCLL